MDPSSHLLPGLSSRAKITIVLDAGGFFDWIVSHMKTKFFAALIGMALVTAGCVKTVNDSHTATVSFGKDNVEQHFPRSVDQVYQAAVAVVNRNGAVITEYIPHDTTNVVRSLKGEAAQCIIWVRVEAVDPQVTSVVVQTRTKGWHNKDLDFASQLLTEIALQLQAQSGS
jgi:hypothetical protein